MELHPEPFDELDGDLAELDDRVLLDFVRGGNANAYAALFARYTNAAHRLARYICNSSDAPDIVSECFIQVFKQLRSGKGPSEHFRAYLFTSIRRESWRRATAAKRVRPTAEVHELDRPVAFDAGEFDGFDRQMMRSAFETLPERWRLVLWHLDVEGRKPHEIAPHLGLSPNAVSALAYRAREGLRQAFLDEHVGSQNELHAAICDDIKHRLAAVVRDKATAREQETVETHLTSCDDCTSAFEELEQVDAGMSSVAGVVALAGSGGVASSVSSGGSLA